MSSRNQPTLLGNYNGVGIVARKKDNHVDVTELCPTHGKQWPDYTRLPSARPFGGAPSANVTKMHIGGEGM
jgi:hypothetical protein